jgi:hypothetical protein
MDGWAPVRLADGWCWFLLREEYCWLIAGGWFVPREKYCWLVADKPSEQGAKRRVFMFTARLFLNLDFDTQESWTPTCRGKSNTPSSFF